VQLARIEVLAATPARTSEPAVRQGLTEETVVQEETAQPSGLAVLGVDPAFLLVQAVNFLILFALLRWALYRPMLAMLNGRREKIERGVAAAEASERAAKDAEAKTTELLRSARAEAQEIVTQARQSADKLAAEVKATTSAEAAALLERTRAQLDAERTALLTDVETRVGELVAVAAEKLAGESARYDAASVRSAVERAKETLV
jgi:F-type H+-transporting ATPase subunit b